MGGQSCEPMVIHSSITLLQERFRQLEKAKEMRQQRQLLSLFSEAERIKPSVNYKPSTLFLHQEVILPHVQPPQSSISHQQYTLSKPRDLQVNEIPKSASLWPIENDAMSIKNNFDASDVDTSLHL